VLRYAATLGEAEFSYVNAAFSANEVEAIATSEPTPGAHDLMRAWSRTGQPLAIVSNNSSVAIQAYLHLHGLRSYVSHVSARANTDPALLKPNPHLLNAAMTALGVSAGVTTFVGDSVTDIEAAHSAGTMSIGYANKPNKIKLLLAGGASAITTSLPCLLNAVSDP
jgi:HAD superfamily hydrolase (TIGR01549 family)